MKKASAFTVAVSALLTATASGHEFIGEVVTVDRSASNRTSKIQVAELQYCKRGDSIDFQGGDFKSVPGGMDTCCEACRINGCRSYTWTDYQGGTCWLKAAVLLTPKIYIGAKGCIVGSFDWETVRFDNCDMPGNDLFHEINYNKAGCEFLCWEYSNCKAATFVPDSSGNTGTCYLKTKVSECVYAPGKFSNVPLNEGIFDGW